MFAQIICEIFVYSYNVLSIQKQKAPALQGRKAQDTPGNAALKGIFPFCALPPQKTGAFAFIAPAGLPALPPGRWSYQRNMR